MQLGILLETIPEIDTSSTNAVLGSFLGLCIVVIIALWMLIAKLAKKNEALQESRLDDERKNASKWERMLKSQWAQQETFTDVTREHAHQQEVFGAKFDGLSTSFDNLSAMLVGGCLKPRPGSTRRGDTDGGS